MVSQTVLVVVVVSAVLEPLPLTARIMKVDSSGAPHLPVVSITPFKPVVLRLTGPETKAKQVLSLRSAFTPYSNILLPYLQNNNK